MSEIKYVVSACLAGLPCRYDGKANPCPAVVALYNAGVALPLCPETLGELKAPRLPCEWQEGRIIDSSGNDLSSAFEKGAEKALQKSVASGCRKAILKSRSPSCGHGQIYDGTFTRTLRAGDGLWAAKLKKAGFEIFSEEDLPENL